MGNPARPAASMASAWPAGRAGTIGASAATCTACSATAMRSTPVPPRRMSKRACAAVQATRPASTTKGRCCGSTATSNIASPRPRITWRRAGEKPRSTRLSRRDAAPIRRAARRAASRRCPSRGRRAGRGCGRPARPPPATEAASATQPRRPIPCARRRRARDGEAPAGRDVQGAGASASRHAAAWAGSARQAAKAACSAASIPPECRRTSQARAASAMSSAGEGGVCRGAGWCLAAGLNAISLKDCRPLANPQRECAVRRRPRAGGRGNGLAPA